MELPGTKAPGGKTALADWHDIALNGRRVIIAFDSDAARKPQVQKAMRRSPRTWHQGATIEYLRLPDTADKTGLDDYLVGHTVDRAVALVKPTQPSDAVRAQQAAPAADATAAAYGSIDGAALLDDVDAYLGDYVVYPASTCGTRTRCGSRTPT